MQNLKRLKGRLTIYVQYCKPRITDDTLKETLQVNGGGGERKEKRQTNM